MVAGKQVYVPVGFAGLQAWVRGDGQIHQGWGVAADLVGVTDADEAELRHYDALWVAAETPEARTLPGQATGVGRRVVFTVLVPSDTPEDDHGVVDLPEAGAALDVVCAHVEDAAAGDDDELLWFDPSELAGVASEPATKR